MSDDRWHCRWPGCDYKHPVARMVEDHEARCEVRPHAEVVRAAV